MYKNDKKLDLSENLRIRIMLDIVNKMKLENKNILDIGCYNGTFLSAIKGKNNLFGIEASDYGFEESFLKGIDVKQFFSLINPAYLLRIIFLILLLLVKLLSIFLIQIFFLKKFLEC